MTTNGAAGIGCAASSQQSWLGLAPAIFCAFLPMM
jgi:hypothetical protein